MAYDLLIKNGTVVDGTGAPRVRADVAIKDGTIAEIGKVSDGAQRTIDAAELIVAPGFVDPHTHYDAQICWDPLLSCTSWHGVTSVRDGQLRSRYRAVQARGARNRGVGPGQRRGDSLRRAEQGHHLGLGDAFPSSWTRPSAAAVGINLGFLAPLTPFRHFVMGEESMERAATPDETEQHRGAAARGDGGGRDGLFHHHARPSISASRASRWPAGSPAATS